MDATSRPLSVYAASGKEVMRPNAEIQHELEERMGLEGLDDFWLVGPYEESGQSPNSYDVERSAKLVKEATALAFTSLLTTPAPITVPAPRLPLQLTTVNPVSQNEIDRDSPMGDLALEDIGFEAYPAPKRGYSIEQRDDGLYYHVPKREESSSKRFKRVMPE